MLTLLKKLSSERALETFRHLLGVVYFMFIKNCEILSPFLRLIDVHVREKGEKNLVHGTLFFTCFLFAFLHYAQHYCIFFLL